MAGKTEKLKKNADTESVTATSDGNKTAQKETKPKQKKPNAFAKFFKRIGKFFKECSLELKKIVWATPSSTLKNTVMVTVAIVVFTAAVFGLDWLFRDVLLKYLGKVPLLIENLFWG